MAEIKKKESEKTLELAQRVAAQEAAKPADWTGGTYGQQVNDALNKILNREKFSYNLNADPLYQQYKDQYMRGGKLAMQDTMGQAAALTGGYGNSYASTAGNQAYQGYLTGLNDKVPDLYSLALSKYSSEGDALRDNLGALQGMYDQEYAEHERKLNDYRTELDRLDSLLADSQDYDYQSARDAIADAQWQAEFDEAVRQWNAKNAPKSGGGSYTPSGDNTVTRANWVDVLHDGVALAEGGADKNALKNEVDALVAAGALTSAEGKAVKKGIDTNNYKGIKPASD